MLLSEFSGGEHPFICNKMTPHRFQYSSHIRKSFMKNIMLLSLLVSFSVEAETFEVAITNFQFTPNDLEIEVGDTVRWTNNSGFHDVTDDGNNFSSGLPSSSPFVFEQTFNSVEEIRYHCTVHSGPGRDINASMNGRINVINSQVVEPTFEINQGISGSWFFPDTSGSGFLIDVRPADQFMFVAWFTHDISDNNRPENDNGSRWYTAAGNYTADTAELDLIETTGGLFDNPQTVSNSLAGTITFEFTDCSTGTVNYEFTNGFDLSGTFPIQRAVPGTESLCDSLVVQ